MSKFTDEILGNIRRAVALQLWELGAVKTNFKEPFKLASGNYSPIYINCRCLISSAAFADLFAAASRLLCEAHDVKFDTLAGGESAGIPFAAFLARSFGKPMVYVRKAAKGHGISSLVEGSLEAGTRVLLVEDLITDAGSKMHFIEALKGAGAIVNDVLVVFDRMQGGGKLLASVNTRLLSVTDMNTVLHVAETAQVLQLNELASVKQYLASPALWHTERQLPHTG